MKKDILYIIMPVYNEIDIIHKVINRWYSVLKNEEMSNESRLCLIDDGSTDGTSKELDYLSRMYPKLLVLHKKNGGHGSAVLYGYKAAIKMKADYIFQTDSDGQTSVKDFEKFWIRRKRFDCIFGWRQIRGDGRLRKMVEDTACLILRVLYGVKIPDSNAPYRLINNRTMKEWLRTMPENCPTPNIFMTLWCVKKDKAYKFLSVRFGNRTTGVNSINFRRIFKIGAETVGLLIDYRETFD